jgi:hypothetical protein
VRRSETGRGNAKRKLGGVYRARKKENNRRRNIKRENEEGKEREGENEGGGVGEKITRGERGQTRENLPQTEQTEDILTWQNQESIKF